MEEHKNQFENTDNEMTENSGNSEQPTTPVQPVVTEETAAEQTAVEKVQAAHAPGPEPENPKEDISYTYGENRKAGMEYRTQGNEPEGEWDTTPLTMGDWLLTLLAALIPCCGGIILYCYWAFARRGNLHRRNFCRAALIVEAVLIVILIVFFILVVIIGSVSYGTMSGDYYYYGY